YDQMFTTIKMVSRHQNTQQFGVMLLVELTNKDIRNSEAYKEYYAVASGAAPPKTKAIVRKMKSTMTEAEQIKLATKRSLQQTHISQASGSGVDEGTGIIPGVTDVPTEESDEEISWKLSDEDDDDDVDERSDDQDDDDDDQDDDDQDESNDDDQDTDNEDLPNFGSLFGFDHRLKTLKANFFEFVQTNQFAGAVSSIPGIVQRYMDQRMNEAVKVAVQIQSDRLRNKAQAENEEFLKNLDENIQKIIKEQVKEQVKVQVSKILLKIEKTVNEQLEAEVLTRSSNSSKTSYAALIEAYGSDKIILNTYGDTITLKRRRDDADKDEEPSAKSDWGSKRRREGKEPKSTSAPKEKATKTIGKSTQMSKSYQKTASESIQPWISDLAKQADSRSSFNELMDTPVDFSAFLMNRLKVDTLTPELLASPTYELMKGSCKSLMELEFFLEEVYKATTDQLDWNNPEGQLYPHNLLKPLPLIPNSRGRRVIPFDHFINNDLEYLRGGAFSRKYTTSVTKTKAVDYGHIKIIAGTELQIVEWHNYKHLDWITMRRGIDFLFKTTSQMDVPASTTVASLTLTAPTLPPPTIPTSS
nr:hypothetical protein [Tanacetum cinerariifolium]